MAKALAIEESLARDAERYRRLVKDSSEHQSNWSLAIYAAVAGTILFLAGIFWPDHSDGPHPMFIAGTGLSLAVAAGAYLLTQRDAEKQRQREIHRIEERFARRDLAVSRDGSVHGSVQSRLVTNPQTLADSADCG